MELHDMGIHSDGMNKVCLYATESKLEIGELQAAKDVYPFTSIVSYAGRPSDYPVGGTEGIQGGPYRVLIPISLLEQNVGDLKGKGVFALPSLREHSNAPVIVGEFLQAWVEYDDVPTAPGVLAVAKASGLLYRKRSPDLVDQIVVEARQGKMGFSYDLKEVEWFLGAAADTTEQIMELTAFKWRGATILYRDAAAYRFTQLAAKKVEATKTDEGDQDMNWSDIKDQMGQLVDQSIIKAVGEVQKSVVTPLDSRVKDLEAENKSLKESNETLKAEIAEIKAALEKLPAEKKEEAKEEPKQKLTAAELVESIGEAVSKATEASTQKTLDALTQLTESMKTLSAGAKSADSGDGSRKTISAQAVQFVNKYNQEEKDPGDVTVDDIKAAAETVKNTVRSKSERVQVLEILSAARRQMQKDQRGGAQ